MITYLLAALLANPADHQVAWGLSDHGIRFGLQFETRNDGPPIVTCHIDNQTKERQCFSPCKGRVAAPVPTSIFKNGQQGAWSFTPPSADPMVIDGPGWYVVVEPGTVAVVSRFRTWFPLHSGDYEVQATFESSRHAMLPGRWNPGPFSIASAWTKLRIDESHAFTTKVTGWDHWVMVRQLRRLRVAQAQ